MSSRNDEKTMEALEAMLLRSEPDVGAITPWELVCFDGGALSDVEASRVRRALSDDPDLRAQLDELRAEERLFLEENPWAAVQDDLFRRAAALPESRRRSWLRSSPDRGWLRPFLALATGAALAVALMMQLAPPNDAITDRPAIRLKGASSLSAYQFEDGRSKPLRRGALLGTGDRIQFRVSTTHSYLALLGVDGTGAVSRYEPGRGERSVAFAPGTAQPIRDSFVLDDAPGPEVFIAFLSDEPLLLSELEAQLNALVAQGGSQAVLGARWGALDAQVEIFHVEKGR